MVDILSYKAGLESSVASSLVSYEQQSIFAGYADIVGPTRVLAEDSCPFRLLELLTVAHLARPGKGAAFFGAS